MRWLVATFGFMFIGVSAYLVLALVIRVFLFGRWILDSTFGTVFPALYPPGSPPVGWLELTIGQIAPLVLGILAGVHSFRASLRVKKGQGATHA
ncbi:MAG TPA: hypothetical protein VMV94_22010 [Phycisphaerae bacterium]|nr:hypothetical protein [Phycisphaerae bacterium]